MSRQPLTPKPDQRAADRGRHARKRWREIFDNLLPVLLTVIVVILAILAVLSVGVIRNSDRQTLTSKNGCERVQLLRDDVNVSAWGVYTILTQNQASAPDPSEVASLLADVDPATRALLTALLAGQGESRALVARVRETQRYLPPTDCNIASQDPTYRFPTPIAFEAVAGCYDPDRNPRPEGPCPRR